MGRYFTESDTKEKMEIFNVKPSEISKAKSLSNKNKGRVKAIKYTKGANFIKKRKSSDPFPGRKPVDPAKVEEHAR